MGNMKKAKLSNDKIGKIRKKGKLNSEMIWKICRKSKLDVVKIYGQYGRK
jgi:hypothetical protein